MKKVAGLIAIIIGAVMFFGGIATWVTVSTTLADQNITVAGDSTCLAEDAVDGPFSAYCEAQIIEHHALDATGGLTYAELGREDPLRAVAQSASFLRASLFTSVVAFGVAALASFSGLMFMLLGVVMRDQVKIVEGMLPRYHK